MTTLNFDILGRDRGATKLLKDVGTQAGVAQKGFAAMQQAAATAGSSVEQAARRMAAAEKKAADAAGAARVAQAKLQELRQKGTASASQMVKAEEAVAKADRNLVAAQKQVAASADAVKKATAAESQSLQKLDKDASKATGSVDHLSNRAGLLGAGLLAGVGVVLKSAAGFDKAMSSVAATGADASKNIEDLRKEAIKMGAATKFSATEAAQGIESLLKAGLSTADVLNGGLAGALNLAAAGSMEVKDAADIAASAMNQFALSSVQIPHVADLLAAAAGKSVGEVKDMSDALKMSGSVAHMYGVSIEETTGFLAAFASAGQIGSDAGTSFKQMLLQLGNPSAKAAGLMEELGISAYDANGNFVGLADIAGQLQDKLGGLTQKQRDQAMATIFGSDAIRAANALFQQGASGISDWTKKVNDAGYAAQVARMKMDNLAGDLETLKGSIETTFIVAGSGANEALRGLTQQATRAVNAFGQLPAPVLETGVKLAGLGGISLLAFAGISKLAIGASETRQAMADLREESPRLAKGLSVLGKAAGVAAIAMTTMQVAGAVANEINGKFVPSVDNAAGALLQLGRSGSNIGDLNRFFSISNDTIDNIDSVSEALARASDPKWSDRLGSWIDRFAGTENTLTKTRLNLESVDKALSSLSTDQAASAFSRMRVEAEASGVPVEKLVGLFPQYSSKIRDAAAASGHTITSQAELADAMANGVAPAANESARALVRTANKSGMLSSEAKQAKKQLHEMTQAMFDSAKAAMELQGSEDGLQAAIDDASKAVKTNGKTLDNNTEKGRNNREALRNLASSSIAYREKLIEQGASQRKVTNTTQEARHEFVATAIKMGASRKEANKLADEFGFLDKKINGLNNKKVTIKFETNAKGEVKRFHGFAINLGVPSSLGRSAQGGPISGPGTGTSDSILGVDRNTRRATSWVSNGEYVVNKKSTQKYRPLVEMINADRLAGGGYVNVNPHAFPSEAMNVPKGANQFATALAKAGGRMFGEAGSKMFKAADRKINGALASANAAAGLPSGGRALGRGMGALFRYGNMLGMGHGTYPGHGERGMNKSWDFSPVGGGRGNALAGHAWAHAKPYGIWYVIWNRRIASRTRPGAGWRPYTRYGRNASPSQAHTNHVHVSWYDKGGLLKPGGVGVNTSGKPERVLTPGQTDSFDRLVRVMDRGGSGAGNTYITVNAPNYVGSQDDLRRTLVDMNRRGQLEVIKGR